MGIFNFFRKKKEVITNVSECLPDDIIKRVAEYVPDFYMDSDQYKACLSHIKDNAFEDALKDLIELADKSGHYFSEEFWNELSDAAVKMNMINEAEYCKLQIERNKTDLKFVTPFGWTIIKIDDTHYQKHTSDKKSEETAWIWRNKHKVHELIKKDGIHKKSLARDGFLYYVKDMKLTEIYYDTNSNKLDISLNEVNNWVLPQKLALTDSDKAEIRNAITEWANKNKESIEFL